MTKNRRINNVLVVCFSVFLIINTSISFYKYFISTSISDFAQLTKKIEPYIQAEPHCINFDITDKNPIIGNVQFADEIGIRSSAIVWAYPGMINYIGRQNNKSHVLDNEDPKCTKIRQKDIVSE